MALVVGELTAYLNVDKSNYERGMQGARQDLQGFSRDVNGKLRDAKGRFVTEGKEMGEGLSSGVGSGTSKVLSRINQMVSSVGGAVGKVATTVVNTAAPLFAAGTTAVAGLVLSAGKAGLAYNGMQQASRAALTTILGGAEKANAQMDKLDAFARNSPFAKQVFITAQQQLLGFGMAANKVLPTLDAIQNATAAVGGSNESIAEIANILAVVTGTGKITAETLNQLGVRGVDAAKLIGSQMGLTANEVRTKITKGTLDAGQALDALVNGMQTSFGGAADNVKQTWVGATDRIKGAWRDIGSAIAEPFVAHKGGGMAITWVNAFADLMRAVQRQTAPVINMILGRFTPALASIGPALVKAREAVDGLSLAKLNAQFDTMSRYAPLIAGVGTALFTLGTKNLPVIGPLVGAVNPLVAGLIALAAASPAMRKAGGDFLEALAPLGPVIADIGKIITGTLMDAVNRLAPILGDLLVAVAPLIVAIGEQLVPIVGTLAGAIDLAIPIVGALVPVVGALASVAEKLAPVLPMVVAGILALKGAQAVGGILGGLAGKLEGAGKALGNFGWQGELAGAGARKAGDGLGKAAGAASKVSGALPLVGAAVGLVGAALANNTKRIDDFAQALLDGGAAAQKAQEDLAKQPSAWDRFSFTLSHIGDSSRKLSVVAAQTEEARKAADELYDSMTPLAQANQDVTKATNDLMAAQETHGRGSRQAQTAARELAAARGRVAQIEKDVAAATKTATEALADQVQQSMNAASADLALRQALLGAEQAQQAYNEALASGDPQQRTQAEQALEGAYLSAAQAAARKAEADNKGKDASQIARASTAAQLEVLEGLAAAAGGKVPAEMQKLIDKLRAASNAAGVSADSMRDLGLKVTEIPGNKTIFIDAPTADQKKRLQDLGLVTRTLPDGRIFVTADTGPAEGTLAAFMNQRRTVQIQAQLSTGGIRYQGAGQQPRAYATGGPILGGTPGRDSVPIMAMPGEHMWTTREVNAAGGHAAVEAMRQAVLGRGPVRGLAAGGPVSPAASTAMSGPRIVDQSTTTVYAHVDAARLAAEMDHRRANREFLLTGVS